MLGSQVTNKQTGHGPLFLELLDCNKRDHSFRHTLRFPSVATMALRRMLCKRTIFCESYMQIHGPMSLIIVTMKVWTVTVTVPQLVHVNNCDLLS
jgi:hypothetical protein